MISDFDPADIDVIEDDYTSNLSFDESENASTLRILGLCEYARGLEARVRELEAVLEPFAKAVWHSTRPEGAPDPEWKTLIDQEHWDNAARVLRGES